MQFHVGMRSSFFPREATSRGALHGAAHCSLLRETVLSGKAMPTYANDALYARVATRLTNALKVIQHRVRKPIIGFLLHYLNTPSSSLFLSPFFSRGNYNENILLVNF